MSEHAPWQRAAAGAGLLGADGRVAPTIFAEMSAIAAETGAINLGQGVPEDDAPAEVLRTAADQVLAGRNQYPPGRGDPDLLSAIAEHESRWHGREVDQAAEVLVTTGATEALAATILALVEPGDEVVALEPAYDAYGALVGLAGGTLVPVPLTFPEHRLDPALLDAAVGPRTRVILLNTPHNPTGAVLGTDELDAVVRAAERVDAVIVTDEVYEHLVYDGEHVRVATRPGAAERTVTISSAGKTFRTTGWKIGWAIGPARLVTAIATVKQFLTYTSGAPFQPAIAAGLRLPAHRFDETASSMRARRDSLVGGLRGLGLEVAVPAAGYFVIADVSPLTDDAAAFCRELPARAGVAAIPVSAFVRPDRADRVRTLARFAFCRSEQAIDEAVRRLSRAASRDTGAG